MGRTGTQGYTKYTHDLIGVELPLLMFVDPQCCPRIPSHLRALYYYQVFKLIRYHLKSKALIILARAGEGDSEGRQVAHDGKLNKATWKSKEY